ncbi:MAG: hypothetical protein ACK4RZ_06530 [Paracoccaceae bacterium]
MACDQQAEHSVVVAKRRNAMRLSDLKRLIAPVTLPKPIKLPRLGAVS